LASSSPLLWIQPRQTQRDHRRAKIPCQPGVVPQVAAEPLVAVPCHDARRDPERIRQFGGAERRARLWPGMLVAGKQFLQVTLQQSVPGQNAAKREEQLLRHMQLRLGGREMRVQQPVAASQNRAFVLDFFLRRLVADDEFRRRAAGVQKVLEIFRSITPSHSPDATALCESQALSVSATNLTA
jgi:hypothetical protein